MKQRESSLSLAQLFEISQKFSLISFSLMCQHLIVAFTEFCPSQLNKDVKRSRFLSTTNLNKHCVIVKTFLACVSFFRSCLLFPWIQKFFENLLRKTKFPNFQISGNISQSTTQCRNILFACLCSVSTLMSVPYCLYCCFVQCILQKIDIHNIALPVF